MSIISTNVPYTYDVLINNMKSLQDKYSILYINSIGKSVLGNDIIYFRIGKGKKQVFYSGAFHGNEWITSIVLMKFIEDFCIAYTNNSTIYGYNAQDIFNSTSIYIVPMLNPDGVNLATGFLNSGAAYNNAKNIANNYPLIPFPTGWKANITGVDLNLQFPARLGKC